eukprot:c28777_g1_i1 orf=990-1952(+)
MPLAWLYNSLKEQFESVHKNEFVVCNSFSELEGGICESLQTEVPDMRLVGPLFLTDFLDDLHSLDAGNRTSLWKEEECLHWLQEQPASSVLYVSFGSFTTLPASQLMEIARGLVSSQQRFLWVIRPDMVEGEASETLSDVIVQCSTTPLGKVIQWASQPVVLSHPAIGGFFSHCGWNSLLESVSMGVPILGWPQMADQVMNCWMMVNEWKVGVGVEVDEKNEVGWEAVERGVRIVMESKEGREMKVQAAQVKEAARRAVAAGGSSHRSVHTLVQHITRMAHTQTQTQTQTHSNDNLLFPELELELELEGTFPEELLLLLL